MGIFVMQASTSLRPARASPPSCPNWGELVHKTGESLIYGSSLFASKLLSIQIACALYPTATNKNLGGNRVGIDTSSTFKSTSIEFEFGVPFDETTGDGTEVRTTATLSGNSLIKDQRAVKSSGVSRIETWNFKNNGQIMELVHTIPGKAN